MLFNLTVITLAVTRLTTRRKKEFGDFWGPPTGEARRLRNRWALDVVRAARHEKAQLLVASGAPPNRTQPHTANQSTSRVYQPPIGAEPPSRLGIGGIHPSFGADCAGTRPRVLDKEIHRCQGETRVLHNVEFFRRGAFIQFPSVWRDDDGAHDNFAIGSVGKQQERRFRSHVEDRLIPWRIQDALGSRTAESPDPSQCAEKEDVISSNKLDSAINRSAGACTRVE
jgi:hypothetical protein